MGCNTSMALEPSVTSVSFNGKRSSISAAEAFAYPPWCLRDVTIDDKVKELIQKSWKTAMRGKSPPFQEAASKNKGLTPLVFFYNSFYETLFLLAPEIKPKFKTGMRVQGRMLAHILGFAVNNLEQSLEMEETLRYLAVQHNRIGVTATDYSTMFVSLTCALKNVLGPELFSTEVRYAWVCAISHLMQVMLPVVVSGQITLDNICLQEVHDYQSLAQINPEFQYEGSVSRRFSRSRSRSKSAKRSSRLGASATNLILDTDVEEE